MSRPNRHATGAFIVTLMLLAVPAGAATRTVNIGPNGQRIFVDQVSMTSTTTINVGDTVEWIWQGNNHSTTSGNCNVGCVPDGQWDSGVRNAPNSFSHTFSKIGSFNYYCIIHGPMFGMRGVVNVVKPDFAITLPNTLMGPIFPGQTASFSGKLSTGTGYSNPVGLSCVGSVPTPCTPAPLNPIPSSTGTAFSVTAGSSTAQNFQFQVQATGTDSSHITHLSPLLTLKVVDLALGTPSPNSITMPSNATSSPVAFTVSGSNGFAGVVTLSCGGLPAGASCNFSPSNTLDFSQLINPVPASVTLKTVHTLQNNYALTINADTPGATTKTQNLSLNVQADYALAITNPLVQVFPGQRGTFNGTVTSLDGYSGMRSE